MSIDIKTHLALPTQETEHLKLNTYHYLEAHMFMMLICIKHIWISHMYSINTGTTGL